MEDQPFEQMLTGGHPNSLGRTIEVVDVVLANPARLADLYACYASTNEIVRLRTSNALKRISLLEPQWLVPYIDQLLNEITQLDQASAQWTLAHLFATLRPFMTSHQHQQATTHLKHNLDHHDDWIVLNMTMDTLAAWSSDNTDLQHWLRMRLERLSQDRRKSVAKRAQKLLSGFHDITPTNEH